MATRIDVVVDHAVAEGSAGEGAAVQQIDGLGERRRHALAVGVVGAARRRRRRHEFAVDAVEARSDDGGESQVRVGVATGDARLEPQALAVPDRAERSGAVVAAPEQRRRRERSVRVALVRVDVRREEEGQLVRALDLAGDVLVVERRVPTLTSAGEQRLVTLPEGAVDVARVALELVDLRHEGDRRAVLVRDLLGSQLVEGVVVGHPQRLLIAEVDLVLAEVALALRVFQLQTRRLHR